MGSMLITNVRFSYFYGFEPFTPRPSAQNPNPKPMFTCHGLMAPDHPDLPRVAAEIEAVGAAHTWKGGMTWDQVKAMCKGGDKLCLHRGDVTKAGKPEYAGLFFISANNKARFTIIDADRKILTAKDGRPYSGCFGNMIVDIYAQDNEWGKRINATITGAQFLRHGDAFGGGAAPAQADEFPMAAASADAAAPSAASDPLAGLV
jgi:hypothetical protein